MKANNNSSSFLNLRLKAEEILKEKSNKDFPFEKDDIQNTTYEFNILQIENELLKEELLNTQKSLLKSESLFNCFLENTPIYVYLKDEETRAIKLSRNFETFLNKPLDEILGKTMFDLFPNDLAKKMVEDDKIALLKGKDVIVEEFFNNKHYLSYKFPVILNEDTKYLAGFTIETTERKQIESELKENEEKYRTLVENLTDSIVIYEEGKIIYTNNESLKLLKINNDEELLGKPVLQYVHPDSHEIVIERMKQTAISNNVLPILEEKLIRPDGTSVNVEIKAIPIVLGNRKVVQLIIHDITERKHYEETLKTKEQIIRSIFDLSFSFVGLLSPEGILLDVNKTALDFIKINLDEVKGKYFWETPWWSHSIEVQNQIKTHIQLASKGETIIDETIHIAKDGSQHIIEYSLRPVFDDNNYLIYIIPEGRDITENKLAQEKLEESKEKYRGLSEATFESIFISEKGICIEQNLSAKINFGYSDEEAIGRYGTEWIVPEDREKVMNNMMAGYEKPYEVTALRKDGTTFPCVLLGKMMNYKGKQVRVTSLSDITEQKIAEDALKTSQIKYQELFEANTDGITIFELKNQDEPIFKIIDMNENAAKMLGYSKEEMLLKTPFELEKDINPQKLKMRETDLLEKGFSNFETKLFHKNGKEIDVEIKVKIINYSQQIALMNIVRDITERKKTELELLTAKLKAEESDNLKSAFLANMSHEIRTPMNGILGFAELLKEPDLSTNKQNEYIEIIERSGNRMLNLINNIIDISKIESGLMEVYYSEVDINEKIIFTHDFFIPEAANKNILLKINTPLQSNDAIIKTDKDKLYSILTNLVKNAIKFTEKGIIEIGYKLKEDYIIFYVKDTGVGIPLNRHKAIFERFIHADIKNKSAYQGAGLGLAITKAYVELLGGQICVESKEGIGSSFYFTIPYIKYSYPPDLNSTIPTEFQKSFFDKKLKILIAEDDETSDLLITTLLNTVSTDILHTTNGTEVINIMKSNPDIDLVLMDINMPELNGYEATKQIRLFNKKVIIIAQTAYALLGDDVKALDAGCNDYIKKPLDNKILKQLIKKYFD